MTNQMRKAMAFLKVRAAVGFGAIVASAFLSPESAEASSLVTLPESASFVGLVDRSCSVASFGQFSTCPAAGRGNSIAFEIDCRNNPHCGGLDYRVFVKAEASPFGPKASVLGQTSGEIGQLGAAAGSGGAAVDYLAEVSPVGVGLGLNVSNVPVIFTAFVEAKALASAWAFADAETPFGSIVACANIPNCVNSPTIIRGSVRANSPFNLTVTAQGSANSADGDGQFGATADPVLAIADALIPGTNINFRDAFAISVSPDVTQTPGPAAVPEPGTFLLLGSGFVLVGAARRRKSRK